MTQAAARPTSAPHLPQTIVGQQGVIEALLLALLSNGHVLLEGPPGLGQNAGLPLAGGGAGRRV